MKFEGDLTKFFPPDLLMFLAKLGKEGLLTVTKNKETVFISLRDGMLADAQSRRTDDKVLITLLYNKHINRKQYQHIAKAKTETGMPIRQILEKLNLFPLENIKEIIKTSIKEVLFQFFLWESGEFQFSDIPLGSDTGSILFKPQTIALEISKWVDEWQEAKRGLLSLDCLAYRNKISYKHGDLSSSEKVVLQMARGSNSIKQIITNSPLTSLDAIKTVAQLLQKKYLKLHQPENIPFENPRISRKNGVFFDFKKAFKKILRTDVLTDKVKSLTDFCEDHFDQTYIISASSQKLIHCIALYKDNNKNRKMKNISDIQHNIHDDPIFSRVFSSKIAFFGKIFQTEVTKGMLSLPDAGECAIIPLGIKPNRMTLIFVVSAKQTTELNPFHYLELLSSLINPMVEKNQQDAADHKNINKQENNGKYSDQTPSASSGLQNNAKNLAKLIDDLPPMPHIAAQVLQIVSDPDSALSDLIDLLSQDQSLMALIIKVSNSVLYRTDYVINTLNDAVNRLGTKAIRSLVLTSSTHSLFPKNNKQLEILSHSLWQHTKECGLASRRVAEAIGYNDPDETFIGGVLHDIGKLAILQKFPEEYRTIKKQQAVKNLPSVIAEKKILGFDHVELGSLLMKKWNMPAGLQACVRHHHSPNTAKEFEMLSYVIAFGNYLSHVHGSEADAALIRKTKEIDAMIQKINLSPDKDMRLHETIIEDFQHTDLFD